MSCIQLALSDAAKADILRNLLSRSTQLQVRCVEQPRLEEACVIVVDPAHLRLLPNPLPFPEDQSRNCKLEPKASGVARFIVSCASRDPKKHPFWAVYATWNVTPKVPVSVLVTKPLLGNPPNDVPGVPTSKLAQPGLPPLKGTAPGGTAGQTMSGSFQFNATGVCAWATPAASTATAAAPNNCLRIVFIIDDSFC